MAPVPFPEGCRCAVLLGFDFDGTSHEVLKNFPTAGAMEKRLARHGSDARFTSYQYYWVASYRIMAG